MLSSLTSNWWLVALRGMLAVIFGVVAFGCFRGRRLRPRPAMQLHSYRQSA